MNKLHYIIVTALVAAVLIGSSVFTLDQRQNAVVFQFGEAVRVVQKPGLKFKIPFIQNIEFFDKRLLNVNVEAKELTAADGKRMIVDAFAKFKIVDPVTFYKTVFTYQGAKLRLNKILESAMRKVIGRVNLVALLTSERNDLMLEIRDLIRSESKVFGIDIVDVRILKADLPPANSTAIYRRMQTEREKQAKQIRAEGKEEAARVISRADKESKIIVSNAYTKSQRIMGQGDSEAAKLYNISYSQDIEFYEFYRSLTTYKKSLKKDNTQFVLSPKSEFFKHLNLN